MADEGDRHPLFFIKRDFKGKDYSHPVYNPADFLHPSHPPGPDLRAYVIKNLYSRLPGQFGYHKVEIWVIYQNEKVRGIGRKKFFKGQVGAADDSEMGNNLNQSDHRHL